MKEPFHCKSLFLKRLQAQCPTLTALLDEGVHMLRAWNASVELGIDFVERSHYGVRLELRSTSSARNATHSVNKVLLQQAAAEHARRFGKTVYGRELGRCGPRCS